MKRLLIAAVAALACVLHINAQNDTEATHNRYPYGFVGIQAGITTLCDDGKLSNTMPPVEALTLGGQFTPVIGLRMALSFNRMKYKWENTGVERYRYMNPTLDGLINLSNLVTGRQHSLFNANVVLGVGMQFSWDNTQKPDAEFDMNMIGRLGMQLAFDLHRNIDLNIEGGSYAIIDYNAGTKNTTAWQPYLTAGITFKFK